MLDDGMEELVGIVMILLMTMGRRILEHPSDGVYGTQRFWFLGLFLLAVAFFFSFFYLSFYFFLHVFIKHRIRSITRSGLVVSEEYTKSCDWLYLCMHMRL